MRDSGRLKTFARQLADIYVARGESRRVRDGQGLVARLGGVDRRTVRKWVAGDRRVPVVVLRHLELLIAVLSGRDVDLESFDRLALNADRHLAANQ